MSTFPVHTGPRLYMSIHIGKIGRLPCTVREQINQRLRNGELAKPILAWLNALPEVRTVLAGRFGGKSINEPNLTHWRKGGYREWLDQQERLYCLRQAAHDWLIKLKVSQGKSSQIKVNQGKIFFKP